MCFHKKIDRKVKANQIIETRPVLNKRTINSTKSIIQRADNRNNLMQRIKSLTARY